MILYDYLYVDLPRVVSLYSQLTGGIIESRETTKEHAQSSDNKRAYDFKILKHDAGGTANDKNGIKETIKPHHSILIELEDELKKQGFLLDINEIIDTVSLRDGQLRKQLKSTLCIKVTGRAVIEDYDRIKGIAKAFPDVTKFVNKSIEKGIKDNPQYKAIEKQLTDLKNQLSQEKDKSKKLVTEQYLRTLKSELAALSTSSPISQVEQWILEGFNTWVDTFLPGIINLRIYPCLERPDEQIFGHLKREFFEDSDTNSFHFTYGSLPTEEITLIGIITAIPTEDTEKFNPLAEFNKTELENSETVESGFRGLFRGFDGFEQMIRTSRFPRILVQPIIVYRSTYGTEKYQRDAAK